MRQAACAHVPAEAAAPCLSIFSLGIPRWTPTNGKATGRGCRGQAAMLHPHTPHTFGRPFGQPLQQRLHHPRHRYQATPRWQGWGEFCRPHMEPFATGLRRMRVRLPALEMRKLGRTDLLVPALCFGTMLFGERNQYSEASALLDMCCEAGASFFDTAEMYPVPQRAETAGLSEQLLGRWLRQRRVPRGSVTVATKAAGPSGQMTWIRGGPLSLNRANIAAAIDGSLMRLQTDYIDLYQIHWPDRYVPMFGDVEYDVSYRFSAVPLEEQLDALGEAVRQGKIRHVGLSNETPWGLMRSIAASDASAASACTGGAAAAPPQATPSPSLPRVASLQNAFSLTCRTFESGGLAEVCAEEGVSLLAYSPLAMGMLTGKYLGPGGGPPGARLNLYRGRYAEAESRYGPRPAVRSAVRRYCGVAARAGLSPLELAVRFVVHRPLVAAAVAGASDAQQLKALLAAAAAPPLPDDVLRAINEVHAELPNPTP
mmetsp:Transcript_14214/g.41381  ORF Transcript_14214/g.41381 Transcript_14214/m.41381 type:complete len:484 (-) Transcript_14214:91-1542(-)